MLIIGVGLGRNTAGQCCRGRGGTRCTFGTALDWSHRTNGRRDHGDCHLGAIYAAHIPGDAPQGMLDGLRGPFSAVASAGLSARADRCLRRAIIDGRKA